LTPIQAMQRISKKLRIEERADGSQNPKLRSVYYWFHKFQSEKYGHLGDQKMYEAIDEMILDPANSILRGKDDLGGMVLALVTPLMKRILSTMDQAAELIFMDSTSHLDLTNISVTLLFTWSPIGGLPIGILFTESQLASAYKTGV